MCNKFIKYIVYKLNKKFKIGFVKSSGRNVTGKICVHHQGGGNKRKNFLIDFFKRIDSYGIVLKIIQSSIYTSYLGLILYLNGLSSYIIISDKLKEKEYLYSGNDLDEGMELLPGYSLPLSYVPLFSNVNNIELYPYSGSIISRAAGLSSLIINKSGKKVILKLKSGWNLTLSNNCLCSIGQSSNPLHRFKALKKAGRVRALGVRPTVRGVAMNPCDHPHGGGEGKKSPPVAARTPWGKLTKGTPTNNKKYQRKHKKLYKVIK